MDGATYTIARVEAVGAGFISGKPHYQVYDADGFNCFAAGTYAECADYVDAMMDCDLGEEGK